MAAERIQIIIDADATGAVAGARRARRALGGLGRDSAVTARQTRTLEGASRRQTATMRGQAVAARGAGRQTVRLGAASRMQGRSAGVAATETRALSHAQVRGRASSFGLFRSVRQLAGIAGLGGLAFGIRGIVGAAVSYEKEMSRVKAVTNATGPQMKQLGELANRMGAATKFSSAEAAEGMYELGAAGFKAKDMGQALKGTLALAAASGIELADASEITANALKGFGLATSDSGHVADVLSKTVNKSSVEMDDLQYSLKYIGPIAQDTGQSFEEMVAAVGEMGDAGIKGDQAGTTLRSALLRLTKPTKEVDKGLKTLGLTVKDVQGPKGLKPLSEIIGLVEKHTKGMGQAQRNAALASIFGQRAMSGMSAVLSRGSGELKAWTKENENANGAAQKAAKTMQDNVAGAWEQLTGSIETAGITLYEKFKVPLHDVLMSATEDINEAGKSAEGFFTTLGQDPDFKGGDFGDKVAALADHLNESDVPEKIAGVISKGIEKGASTAASTFAKVAPKAAKAFVKGFVGASPWARALGIAFILRKFGGVAGMRSAGLRLGERFGMSFAAGASPGLAATATRARLVGVSGLPGGAGRLRGASRGAAAGVVAGRGARAAGQLRNVGRAGSAALGGPVGIAAIAALLGIPEIVKATRKQKTQQFGLPKFSRYENMARGVGLPRLRKAPADDLKKFGDEAEKAFKKAKKLHDIKGLRKLATDADHLAKRFPKARRELGRFAGAARDAGNAFVGAGIATRKRDIVNLSSLKKASYGIRDLRVRGVHDISDLRAQMRRNTRDIARGTKKDSESARTAMSANFSAGVKAVVSAIGDGRISAKVGFREIARITDRQMRSAHNSMSTASADGKRALTRNFKASVQAIRDAMANGTISTRAGMAAINRIYAKNMKLYGLSEKAHSAAVNHIHPITKKPPHKLSGDHAGGGYIGRPGERGRDNVHAVLGRGEYVANAADQGHINHALGAAKAAGVSRFGSLTEMARGPRRPHYLAQGGYAGGLQPQSFAGGGFSGLKPGIRSAAEEVVKRFGLVVTSTTGGTHAAGSYHYRGEAADIGGNPASMNRAAAWVLSSGLFRKLAEGIHNPNLSVKHGARVPSSFWGASTWAGHANHIHLARSGAGGLGGLAGGPAEAPKIKRIMAQGVGGSLGDIVQGTLDRARKAAQAKLDATAAAAGAAGDVDPGGGFTGGVGKGGFSKSQLEQLWVGAGGPKGLSNTAAAVALAESGGKTRAHNPSGASGLWQILGSVVPGDVFDPHINAKNAVSKWRSAHGFSPWVAYTNGAYKRYLAEGGFVGEPPPPPPDLRALAEGGFAGGAPFARGGPVAKRGHGRKVKSGAAKKLEHAKKHKTSTHKTKTRKPKSKGDYHGPGDRGGIQRGKPGEMRRLKILKVPEIDEVSKLSDQLAQLDQDYQNSQRVYGLTDEEPTRSIAADQASDAQLHAAGLSGSDIERLRGEDPEPDVEVRDEQSINQHVAEIDGLVGIKQRAAFTLAAQKRVSGAGMAKLADAIKERVARINEIKARAQANIKRVRQLYDRIRLMNRSEDKLEKQIKGSKGSERKRLSKRLKSLKAEHKTKRHAIGKELDWLRDDNEVLVGDRSVDVDLGGGAGGVLGETRSARDTWTQRRDDLRGIDSDIGQKMLDVGLDVSELQKERSSWTLTPAPKIDVPQVTDDAGTDDRGLADLLREQLTQSQAQSRLLASQFSTLRDFEPLVAGRMVGSFAHGTLRVPETGMAMVHRDEIIVPDPQGPYGSQLAAPSAAAGKAAAPVVNLYVDGDIGPMVGRIRAEIDGRAASVTSRQLGRRARVLGAAPGGNK